jgi:hypothetical protein
MVRTDQAVAAVEILALAALRAVTVAPVSVGHKQVTVRLRVLAVAVVLAARLTLPVVTAVCMAVVVRWVRSLPVHSVPALTA